LRRPSPTATAALWLPGAPHLRGFAVFAVDLFCSDEDGRESF